VDFSADSDVFLADFSVDVVGPSDVSFKGILDQPDQVFGDDMRVVSTEYELVFKTSAVALKTSDQLTIGADTFKVREGPFKTSDGAFSKVLLSKVAA